MANQYTKGTGDRESFWYGSTVPGFCRRQQRGGDDKWEISPNAKKQAKRGGE